MSPISTSQAGKKSNTATRIFRLNAAGLISSGTTLNSDITAMYPDASAWPTDE